jgi:hypothetical protein
LGIGGGCATALAELGTQSAAEPTIDTGSAYVTIADINIESGRALARELAEKGLVSISICNL